MSHFMYSTELVLYYPSPYHHKIQRPVFLSAKCDPWEPFRIRRGTYWGGFTNKRGHLMLDELQLQFHLVPTTPLLLSSFVFVFVVAVLIEAGKRVTGRLQIEARSRLLRILDAKDRAKVRLHRIGRGLTAVDTLRVGIGRVFVLRALQRGYFFSVRDLDVDAMYAGAAWLVGKHDFRNLCKLDPENQLISFQRWVVCPMVISNVHVLDVVGNAYLYNRVWYTTAVLLLIGARLEVPSVVPTLLNSDPDERRIAAHVLSLAVLPEGKKTPLAHVRKGLHRTVLAVVRACRAPARRGDRGRTLPCRRSAIAQTCYLRGRFDVDMANEKERWAVGGAVGRWDDMTGTTCDERKGRNG
ncbi:hypothetical protein EDB83DRAFT_2442584 [Lactarius deliciosus]|nr:hypothetical protein EDB83DRAFT_2442584 [Lactarius deliciosus]